MQDFVFQTKTVQELSWFHYNCDCVPKELDPVSSKSVPHELPNQLNSFFFTFFSFFLKKNNE